MSILSESVSHTFLTSEKKANRYSFFLLIKYVVFANKLIIYVVLERIFLHENTYIFILIQERMRCICENFVSHRNEKCQYIKLFILLMTKNKRLHTTTNRTFTNIHYY